MSIDLNKITNPQNGDVIKDVDGTIKIWDGTAWLPIGHAHIPGSSGVVWLSRGGGHTHAKSSVSVGSTVAEPTAQTYHNPIGPIITKANMTWTCSISDLCRLNGGTENPVGHKCWRCENKESQ